MQELGYKVESERNLVAKLDDQQRFIPQVDFDDPANFARYASAEKYYVDAIERIYKDYPYDGSEAEIQEFRNQENFVDRYIFNTRYPRTTGYAIFSADGWGSQVGESNGYGLSDNVEYIKIIDINKIIKPYVKKNNYKIFIAYYLNKVRLIDNI